jgi:cobalt-zinc-cadmium resistance protein CzcA
VVPDDDALRRLDVPRELLHDTVSAALQGLELAPRFAGVQRIERVVRFPDDGRLTASALARLPLVVEQGRIVELGQVARIEEAPTPAMVRRKNGQRRLGFNVRVTGDLGGTARRIESAVRALALPPGATFALSGKIEEARETQRRLWIASAVALLLVVLLAHRSRWRGVAVVIATAGRPRRPLPLWLAGNLNASSIIGLIGLFGVAVQNSLVLIAQSATRWSPASPSAKPRQPPPARRPKPMIWRRHPRPPPVLAGLAGSDSSGRWRSSDRRTGASTHYPCCRRLRAFRAASRKRWGLTLGWV